MPLTETTKQKIKAVLDKLTPSERAKALKLAALNREIRKRNEAERVLCQTGQKQGMSH